ncbi:MAG: type 2 lantipeptide synthetase LanM family protein [Myxococcales bacterium]|nr:type 2 lantipeptide synthetase LanM family protein [Myxococcales bacterium]
MIASSTTEPAEIAPLPLLVAPAIARARAELRARLVELAASADVEFDPVDLESQLFAPLAERLGRMASRTLALELRVADLQGLLVGDDPRSRYVDFVARLAEPEYAAALLDEYGVLRDQLHGAIDRWVGVSVAIVRHLVEDTAALADLFGSLGRLVEVSTGAGDPHRGGRSVAILRFDGGRRLVYKPRSLAVDRHVQELLAWLDARGDHPPFRRLAVLDRADHGWVEWVEARPATSMDEARAYYRRLGGLAAVTYVLGAIDLHHENLIAAGEHPVLLDVETLFHPDLLELDDGVAHERSLRLLADSVAGSGMLPQRGVDASGNLGPDLSGLGVDGVQTMSHLVPRWVDAGTTAMRLTRAPAQLRGAHNRAVVAGVATDPVVFVDDMVAGFDAVYRCMMAHADELAAPTGPIAAFANDEIRVLLRPTRAYFRLLDESFHPDVLRDLEDRQRLFERLRDVASPLRIPAGACDAELVELWRADIPMFTTTPSSRHLESHGGRVPDALGESGLDRAFRRIAALDEDDRARQAWVLGATLATLPSSHRRPEPPRTEAAKIDAIDPARALAAARAIVERLSSQAILGTTDATWLGLTSWGDAGARLVPLDQGLYDGLPGVALLLGYFGAVTGDAAATELSRRAVAGVRGNLAIDGMPADLGAFSGAGGLIYTFAHLAALWGDTALLDHAHAIADDLRARAGSDATFDVVGGVAGAILGLGALWSVDPRSTVVEAAIACGERLLAGAREDGVALVWPPSATPTGLPLTGFSHGAAGIAAALAELHAITGDPRWRASAERALAYERSRFDVARGNWPDLRFGEDDGAFQTAWCHGAPGIGLARLRSLGLATSPASRGDGTSDRDDAVAHEEIRAALGTTIAHGFAGSHCLCHGGFGNLELLIAAHAAGGIGDRDELERTIATQTTRFLDELDRVGPRCATRTGVETPGLMTGLAGIAFALLRLAAPTQVPSVLVLERPRGAG